MPVRNRSSVEVDSRSQETIRLLGNAGLSREEAEATRTILGHLAAIPDRERRFLVHGTAFRVAFGRRGQGTPEALVKLAERLGLDD